MNDYEKFLADKDVAGQDYGFAPKRLSDSLKPFQHFIVDWAVRKGKAAVFADCGLGKSFIELACAEQCIRKTNKPALILTPLSVSAQMVREGEKFGIECQQSRDGRYKGKTIVVTNYERLQYFNPSDFCFVGADESGILKNYQGKLRKRITAFVKKVPYRLLATATPSPNDYMELGNSSEALGVMGYSQMLGMFFTNGQKQTQQWTLKGHARRGFWRWVASWARALRKPSDLGFDDDGYILPELKTVQHVVKRTTPPGGRRRGFFHIAVTLNEQREERRATIKERCEKVASLLPKNDYAVVWCHWNEEGDLLERIIPGAVQVQGSDRDEVKEERLLGFSNGEFKVLVTKPKIGGFGLNWQHCNYMTVFPSHSYEQFYQSIRRCWRFGQDREVTVDVVTTEGESRVLMNMMRKDKAAADMFAGLVTAMREFYQEKPKQLATEKVSLPLWLK